MPFTPTAGVDVPRVVVIGGGISGLATAAFLEEVDVTVLESGEVAGGNVRTDIVDGRVLDRAANGWLDSEPAMSRLLVRLGLDAEITPASDRSATRWVYANGEMHAVPLSPLALIKSSLIPWYAKLRLLFEPLMPRGRKGADETVEAFVRRRLGPFFVDRLVAPMVAGIYAADPGHLSLAAAFPKMASMEAEYRSLFRAMLAKRRGGAPAGHLETLPRGAGQLTDALIERLGDKLHCERPAEGLTKTKDGWRVHTPTGDVDADAVVLAAPAPVCARLMRGLDPGVANAFDEIPYAPIAVVVTAWPAGAFDRSPEGFGVLVARGEDIGVLGMLFTNEAFPNQSPEGEFLTRTMVGGAANPAAASLPHQELLDLVFEAHERFLGSRRADPILTRAYHHPKGIPQYTIGHPARVATIANAQDRFGGLFFAGNHLSGIGVKDCAATGERIAADVRGWLDITAPTETLG